MIVYVYYKKDSHQARTLHDVIRVDHDKENGTVTYTKQDGETFCYDTHNYKSVIFQH